MRDWILLFLIVLGIAFGFFGFGLENNPKEYHNSKAEEYSDRISTDGEYFKDSFGVCYVGHNIGARDSFLASVPCDKVGL